MPIPFLYLIFLVKKSDRGIGIWHHSDKKRKQLLLKCRHYPVSL